VSATSGPTRAAADAARGLGVAAVDVAGNLWTTTFRDPARDNHLRLGGLTRLERQAARFGLVLLVIGLLSVLSARVWREGTMYAIEAGGGLLFVPSGLVSATLVALFVAWTLIGWGALTASWFLRVLIALAFVVVNAYFAVGVPAFGGSEIDWGNRLVVAGFWAYPALLVASTALVLVPRLRPVGLPLLRALTAAATLALFGGLLWIRAELVNVVGRHGVEVVVDGAIEQTDGLLLPLVFVSGIVVVDFGLSVSEGLAEGVRDLTLRLLRWLLVGLLAVKLWVEVVQRRTDLYVYLRDRPDAVARTVTMTLLLVVVVVLVTRFPATSGWEAAKETVLYGGGIALAMGFLVATFVYGIGTLDTLRQGTGDLPTWVRDYPALTVARYGNVTMAILAVVVGIMLMRRGQRPFQRELGSGLVVIGAWTLPTLVMQLGDFRIGFSTWLMDVLVTLGIAAYTAARWTSLRAGDVVMLLALTVFSWLTLSQGDWLAAMGGLLGLSAIVVVVVGVALALVTDAGFTAEASPRLPQSSRVLLFLGYLLFSVTLLHWNQVAHTTSVTDDSGATGFLLIGIPWAGWLVGRRLVRLEQQPVDSPVG
jgi:hypothetical protein